MNSISVTYLFFYFVNVLCYTYAQSTFAQKGYTKDSAVASQYVETGYRLCDETEHLKGIANFKKAAVIYKKYKKWEQYVTTCNTIARYYSVENEFAHSKAYVDTALQVSTKYLPENNLEKALSYKELAAYYKYGIRDYAAATTYARKSLRIFHKLEQNQEILEKTASANEFIGRLFRSQKMYDSSYIYIKKAVKFYEKIHRKVSNKETRYQLGDTYIVLGYYFHKIEQFDSALCYYFKSVKIFENNTTKRAKWFISHNYSLISGVYRILNNDSLAIDYAQKCLQLNKEAFGPHDYKVSVSHRALARAYSENKQYIKALKHFQKGLKIIVSDFNDTSIYANPSLKEYVLNYHVRLFLWGKASCLKKMYKETLDIKDLKAAFSTSKLVLDLGDSIRDDFTYRESNKEFLKEEWNSFEIALEIADQLYNVTGREEYIDEAFQIAEKSKAFMLWRSLHNMEAKNNGLPPKYRDKEKWLQERVTDFQEKKWSAQKEKNSNRMHAFVDSFLIAKQDYQQFKLKIKEKYPYYYKFNYDKSVVSMQQLQKSMDNNTLLLSYFIGDEAWYVFYISKKHVGFAKIDNIAENLRLITQLSRELTTLPTSDKKGKYIKYQYFTESAYQLSKKLVLPFLTKFDGHFNRLTIIPDGALSHIPFEILLVEPPDSFMIKSVNYRNLGYLMHRYAISYNHSATLQLFHTEKEAGQNNKKCLAFAPNYTGKSTTRNIVMRGSMNYLRGQPLEMLPGTQKEVKGISSCFDGTFMFGEQATESNFKKEVQEYAIVHLAMHGMSDLVNDQYSKLVFSQAPQQLEDDTLFNYELNNIRLKADLVVLSACETGKGNFVRGEGVMSLARGFMQAGSPSVVQTLWQSADQASTVIITNFYKGLANGMQKDMALQEARLKYVRENTNELYSHPFYWAGYVLTGNNKPVLMANTFSSTWLIFILSLVAVAGLILVVKFKKHKAHD